MEESKAQLFPSSQWNVTSGEIITDFWQVRGEAEANALMYSLRKGYEQVEKSHVAEEVFEIRASTKKLTEPVNTWQVTTSEGHEAISEHPTFVQMEYGSADEKADHTLLVQMRDASDKSSDAYSSSKFKTSAGQGFADLYRHGQTDYLRLTYNLEHTMTVWCRGDILITSAGRAQLWTTEQVQDLITDEFQSVKDFIGLIPAIPTRTGYSNMWLKKKADVENALRGDRKLTELWAYDSWNTTLYPTFSP